MQAPPKSIFLSYRREDSEEVVNRIYDTLAEEFSQQALFRDLDDIAPGEDFPAVMRQRLRDCDVVLVFIGRDWLTVQAQGQPRLLDPNDHVRMEVQAALAHPHAQVIPVLVKRADMPRVERLPATLAPLATRNALSVRSAGRDYRQDVQALVQAIAQGIERSAKRRRAAAERKPEPGLPGEGVGSGSSIAPLSEASWRRMLEVLASHAMVVVCGSAFGCDPAQGDPACREAPMAAWAAARLGVPTPPATSRRPLAELAEFSYREGRRDEFARILRESMVASTPVSGLDALRGIEPLRLFITAALEPCIEMALGSQRGVAVASEAYSVAEPGRLDRLDLDQCRRWCSTCAARRLGCTATPH